MDKLYSFIPKKTLTVIIVLILIIISLILIITLKPSKQVSQPPLPVISQSPAPISPLQKTIIGKTKPEDIEKSYQVKDKKVLPNGDLSYSISSELIDRPDQIIFHNNLAQFESTVIVGRTTLSNFIKLSDQVLKYGPAEKIIRGSSFYGYHMDTYIYPAKGIAFIANTNTDEVFEIQTFTPTSLDNYLNSYGEDINMNPVVKDEF